MTFKCIIYKKRNRIAYITINRPDVMNAVDPPTAYELWKAWCNFRDDPDAWVAIITGAGNQAFSAGNDLKYSANLSGAELDQQWPPGGFGGNTEFECWKPSIAAINGLALGGGLEMALACDIIVAAEHAKLGLPEPRVGYVPDAGGMYRMPRHIPLKIAMGMLLTGKQITAQEACQIGLVNEVVSMEKLIATAEKWAREIMECAPLQVRAIKQTVMLGLESPLSIALKSKFPLVRKAQASEDWREGPKAFKEKKKPMWQSK